MSKEPKINSLAVEFQPDAVEISLRPLPFLARLGVWLGLIFFISAIVASYFARVDVVVNATGKMVSKDQNIVMKPLQSAVVQSIEVKVGEIVHKDQLLITFDPTINDAEEQRLESERESTQAQYDRWSAEFNGTDYKPDMASANQNEKWQAAIFQQRAKYYEERLRYFDESIKRVEANIATTRTTVAKQRERFASLDEINTIYENLHEQGVATRKELLEVRMSHIELDAEIAQLDNSIRVSEHERELTIAYRQTFVMEWQKEISEQLVAAEQDLTSVLKSLDKIRRMKVYNELYAPCEAIVHEIAPYPVGSSVREGEAIITLVPINCEIELEAEIPAKDIGRVSTGDTVRVKLTAFPFQKHGTLTGSVRNISEDTFQRNPSERNDRTLVGSTYYRARIPVTGKLRNVHSNFRLIPGMECQAEIKVGTRSVLEYIVYPLIKSLDEAIREP